MMLTGAVALVTGGARGIGLAAAKALSRHGARVVIADRLMEEGRAAVAALREAGADAVALSVNQRDRTQVAEMVSAVRDLYGRVDILFANAGVARLKPFLEITPEEWNLVVDVNLTGTFHVCQAVARQMVRQGGGGRIIITTSINAEFNSNQLAHYCASKAGLRLLTKCMAAELGTHRITVNAIAPGIIRTTLSEPLLRESAVARMIELTTPLGRAGTAEEVAEVVVFLASPVASYITGQTITVCGGHTVQSIPAYRPLDYSIEGVP